MAANRRRLDHMTPIGARPAGVKVGRTQGQGTGCAVQHDPCDPAGAVGRDRIGHLVGHTVTNVGKRAGTTAGRMNHTADRLRKAGRGHAVQDHLSHRELALNCLAARFEIHRPAQAIPIGIALGRRQAVQPGIGIVEQDGFARLFGSDGNLRPFGKSRQRGIGQRVHGVMFGRKQRGELRPHQGRRIVGLAHRYIGEGLARKDDHGDRRHRPAKLQAHCLVFLVVSPSHPVADAGQRGSELKRKIRSVYPSGRNTTEFATNCAEFRRNS